MTEIIKQPPIRDKDIFLGIKFILVKSEYITAEKIDSMLELDIKSLKLQDDLCIDSMSKLMLEHDLEELLNLPQLNINTADIITVGDLLNAYIDTVGIDVNT